MFVRSNPQKPNQKTYFFPTSTMAFERKFLKIPGGKQDQYAAVFGGINYMDFEKNGRVIVNRLNIVHDIINELEDNLVLFNTDQRRNHHEVINKQIKNIGVSNNKTINNNCGNTTNNNTTNKNNNAK